jgi:DNA-binding response OmpR family regulator
MTTPIRALVVEDDDRLARFTKEYLEQRGVLVTHVRQVAWATGACRCTGRP